MRPVCATALHKPRSRPYPIERTMVNHTDPIQSPASQLKPGDALLIVDVQNDFCPGGLLAVESGNDVVPVLNRWIDAAWQQNVPIYASRDWHPPGHVSFSERGGPWPTHCVQNTDGAAFHPDLNLPDDATIVSKGDDKDRDAYSAFDGTDLAEQLRQQNIRRLWVGGLAQDVCVKATVLDGEHEGFDVHVITDATRPVNAKSGRKALHEMARAGATLEPHGEVPA